MQFGFYLSLCSADQLSYLFSRHLCSLGDIGVMDLGSALVGMHDCCFTSSWWQLAQHYGHML